MTTYEVILLVLLSIEVGSIIFLIILVTKKKDFVRFEEKHLKILDNIDKSSGRVVDGVRSIDEKMLQLYEEIRDLNIGLRSAIAHESETQVSVAKTHTSQIVDGISALKNTVSSSGKESIDAIESMRKSIEDSVRF